MSELEMIDSIIVQLNQSVGKALGGNYIGWMGDQYDAMQKILALRRVMSERAEANAEVNENGGN